MPWFTYIQQVVMPGLLSGSKVNVCSCRSNQHWRLPSFGMAYLPHLEGGLGLQLNLPHDAKQLVCRCGLWLLQLFYPVIENKHHIRLARLEMQLPGVIPAVCMRDRGICERLGVGMHMGEGKAWQANRVRNTALCIVLVQMQNGGSKLRHLLSCCNHSGCSPLKPLVRGHHNSLNTRWAHMLLQPLLGPIIPCNLILTASGTPWPGKPW